MGNMDSVIFLGGREHTTVKELSEALGKSTVAMHTESRTRGQQESYGQNLQYLGRELMTIDELTTMDGNKCILQLRGLRPFFSPKYDLRKHPNFKYTEEADKKKNAFNAAELISTKLTLTPQDKITVVEVNVSETEIVENAVNGDIDEDILNYDDVDDPDAPA